MRQQSAGLPVLLVLLLVVGSASLSEAQPSSGKLAPYNCFFNECAASKANQDILRALGNCLKSGRQPEAHKCRQLRQHRPSRLPPVPDHAGCLLSLPAAFPAATAKVVLPGSPAFAEAKS